MKVTITEHQHALLQKREAALRQASHEIDLAELAHKAVLEKRGREQQALNDVFSYLSPDRDLADYSSFRFGKDKEGYFLDLQEKPVEPKQTDPGPTPPDQPATEQP